MKRNQPRRNQPPQFTKQAILKRVDEIQVLNGCDRLRALLILRDRHPQEWDQLGLIFLAESRRQSKAA